MVVDTPSGPESITVSDTVWVVGVRIAGNKRQIREVSTQIRSELMAKHAQTLRNPSNLMLLPLHIAQRRWPAAWRDWSRLHPAPPPAGGSTPSGRDPVDSGNE